MQTFLGGGMAFKAPQTASHAGVAGGESLQKEKKSEKDTNAQNVLIF